VETRCADAGPRASEEVAMDFAFVGVAVGFFALTWGFVRLCERL
jgi:hypothetical protein